jgi:hypothetical protein
VETDSNGIQISLVYREKWSKIEWNARSNEKWS